MRPDIADALAVYLEVPPAGNPSPLSGLSIGEIGIVYEALLAHHNHGHRRSQGQYFTPDDVAQFMAEQSSQFPYGSWIDPCCGVGNLAWHLSNSMDDPADFVCTRLTLVDLDPVALKTAVALITVSFAGPDSHRTLTALADRSKRQNYLAAKRPPIHDFAILNPPYAATARDDRFQTADARDLYAYFMEKVLTDSTGFIAVTPAAYLSGKKFHALRRMLAERAGGDVFVFDNVPDTVFRGFKYGSTNTSKTNFVRAAITVTSPTDSEWSITPILRWSVKSRHTLWATAREYLRPLRKGPTGEWVKLMPGTEEVWHQVSHASRRLQDLLASAPTEYSLEIAATPRYYISASRRRLERGSKHTLYFRSSADEELAYLVLNSSLPYWWWRSLEGGITLSSRTLRSLPIPERVEVNPQLVRALHTSEEEHVVSKLNAGRMNENVRRPRELVQCIDSHILRGIEFDFSRTFASDMFAEGTGIL